MSELVPEFRRVLTDRDYSNLARVSEFEERNILGQ